MRIIRTLIVGLFAVFALSAAAVASAAPIAPELGECTKVAAGKYEDAGCTKEVATGGKYEWHAGPSAGEETFTSTGKKTVLEGVSGEKITCPEVNNTGKYNGAFEDETTIKFVGCESETLKESCQNTATAGEIEIRLKSTLGIISLGPPIEVGVDLEGVAGKPLAEFKCSGIEVIVTGSVIAPETVTNKMESKFKQDFEETKGHQEPEHFVNLAGEPLPNDTLTTEIPLLKKVEQSGQKVKVTITNESKVEIRDEVS